MWYFRGDTRLPCSVESAPGPHGPRLVFTNEHGMRALGQPGRDGRRHVGGGATHAWVRVYLPGAGWVEFDPTNGIVGNRDLIRVAVAREASQAVPLSGTWTGFPADSLGMEVEVHVTSAEPGAADGPAAAAPAPAPSPAASDAALV